MLVIFKVNTTKKVDRLSAKNKKKLGYKQLRLSDDYLYSSEEEQEEEQEKQEENKKNKMNKKNNIKHPLIQMK